MENLKAQQNDYLNGTKNFDNGNDFASYKILAETGNFEASNIINHNAIGRRAYTTAKIYKRFLPKGKLKIADFGGGAGFIANELQKLTGAEIHSYDIAEDAHKYGRKNFPAVQFHTVGLSDEMILPEAPFNAVIANEFYPFIRTSEYESYQRNYIKMGLDDSGEGGGILYRSSGLCAA